MSNDVNQTILKLIGRQLVAERTMAFKFEKPDGFQSRPGQWIDLTFEHPSETDDEGNTRGFSLANGPEEDFILVATRMRDTAFKRELARIPIGSELLLTGQGGSFALHNKAERAAVFVIGGIGITPVRAILHHAAVEHLPHQIVLLYSNRRPQDAAFLDELRELEQAIPHFTFVPVMTAPPETIPEWEGEKGRIDPAMIHKYSDGLPSPIYYIVGPAPMVNALHEVLNQAGVDDDDIRAEDFSGY